MSLAVSFSSLMFLEVKPALESPLAVMSPLEFSWLPWLLLKGLGCHIICWIFVFSAVGCSLSVMSMAVMPAGECPWLPYQLVKARGCNSSSLNIWWTSCQPLNAPGTDVSCWMVLGVLPVPKFLWLSFQLLIAPSSHFYSWKKTPAKCPCVSAAQHVSHRMFVRPWLSCQPLNAPGCLVCRCYRIKG